MSPSHMSIFTKRSSETDRQIVILILIQFTLVKYCCNDAPYVGIKVFCACAELPLLLLIPFCFLWGARRRRCRHGRPAMAGRSIGAPGGEGESGEEKRGDGSSSLFPPFPIVRRNPAGPRRSGARLRRSGCDLSPQEGRGDATPVNQATKHKLV